MKLFTATLAIASFSSAIHLSQLNWYEDDEITDQAKAVAEGIFERCDTSDDGTCAEAESDALLAPLHDMEGLSDLLLAAEGALEHLYASATCSGEDYDYDACFTEMTKILDGAHNDLADLMTKNQVPADLLDLDEVFAWAKDATTEGETTEADLAQEV